MPESKLEFAATTRVDHLHKEVSSILWRIASMMKEEGETEEGWLQYAFIADESRLLEFLSEESEVAELRNRLNSPDLGWHDLFVDVASALRYKSA